MRPKLMWSATEIVSLNYALVDRKVQMGSLCRNNRQGNRVFISTFNSLRLT